MLFTVETVSNYMITTCITFHTVSLQGGKTPLHQASLEGREGVVSLLLQRGADVNIKDNVSHAYLYTTIIKRMNYFVFA